MSFVRGVLVVVGVGLGWKLRPWSAAFRGFKGCSREDASGTGGFSMRVASQKAHATG